LIEFKWVSTGGEQLVNNFHLTITSRGSKNFRRRAHVLATLELSLKGITRVEKNS
jgi:hypothetical protein